MTPGRRRCHNRHDPLSRPRLLVAVAALVALLALVAVPGAQADGGSRHHARSADRNRDRIPDRWERQFHLSLKRDQARRDQDHDGLRNRAEYLAAPPTRATPTRTATAAATAARTRARSSPSTARPSS